ncbi:MAG: wax ester/triacylglycerol synthase family O-acyltransferase [Anaerolineaceae bacterium]|nr:MAG: wax ester/triacylglycerol synthase family O-acyltransferase [Anaerolineaceae bacterium]
MTDKFASFLGPVDTAFYYVESDEAPMNIGSVSIFEGRVSFEEVLKTIDSRLHHAPIYQQKVIQAPFSLSAPVWVYDTEFNIHNHVIKVDIDPPGDDEALRLTASRLLSSPLGRGKPLWEIYMIDGLSDDRTALFFKIHHCMVDGLAAVELFTLLFDLTADKPPLEPKPTYDPPEEPTTGELLIEAAKRDPSHKFNILKKLGGDLGTMFDIFRQKEQRRKALIGLANMVNDNLKPIRKLPINGKNSGDQQLAWAEFSLSEIRQIKSARGTSVNDVMLAVLSGAIERYASEREPNNKQDFLRILIPVSMRLEQERGAYGNRISVLPVDVPFGKESPLDRLSAVHTYTSTMKASSLSNSLDMLLTVPALLPSIAQPAVWSIAPAAFSVLAHTWCTNVAGPQIPVYLRGHKLIRNYGYFPLNPSMGLACVVLSYDQRVTMTLVADSEIVPDVTVVRDYLVTCYEALRRAAEVPPSKPIEFSREKSAAAEPQAETTAPPVPIEPEQAAPPQPEATASPEEEAPPAPEPLEPVPAVPTPPSEPAPQSAPPAKPKLFSDAWAKAYQQAINDNPNYYKTSTRWTAGPLAFIMRPSAKNGFPQEAAVILDLHKGKCRAARALPPHEARREATFVIEGEYENWMKALSGQAQPLPMLIRGKLKLKKGALARLMPFTQSAQELIKSAQRI